jgi:hypothetical protein
MSDAVESSRPGRPERTGEPGPLGTPGMRGIERPYDLLGSFDKPGLTGTRLIGPRHSFARPS